MTFSMDTLDEARRVLHDRVRPHVLEPYVDDLLRRAVAKANLFNCSLSRAVDMLIPPSSSEAS